jgi:hypothetical protein
MSKSRSYWQAVSLHSSASKDALRSWFASLADDMEPYKAEILCDIATDREKKLRAFMVNREGKHFELTRSRGSRGHYSITIKGKPT